MMESGNNRNGRRVTRSMTTKGNSKTDDQSLSRRKAADKVLQDNGSLLRQTVDLVDYIPQDDRSGSRRKAADKVLEHRGSLMLETVDLVYSTPPDNQSVSTRRLGDKLLQTNKSTVMQTVDLVDDSPKPEVKKKRTVMLDGWLEIELDDEPEEEPIEEVKALWFQKLDKIERFNLKRSEPLLPIFEYFGKLYGIETNRVRVVNENFDRINPYDSIETLGLTVANFLIASIIKGDKVTSTSGLYNISKENMVEIKCQFKNMKRPVICQIHRNQPLSSLKEQCAEKIGCEPQKLRLYFDGDLIEFNETPTSLDFEGGECIDIHVD